MNEFLYLYPIYEFAKPLVGTSKWDSGEKDNIYQRLAEIIRARYRQTDTRINWLLFSRSKNSLEPDLSVATQELFLPDDRLLVSGITFDDLIVNKQYPNLDFILSYLLPTPDNLVIAGFHLWDCVDKLAAMAYNSGIPTTVDEDLTELFFFGYDSGKIPTIRTARKLGIPEYMVDYCRKSRINKPWLTQV